MFSNNTTYDFYFLPDRNTKYRIIAMTTTVIKIPKPIPALKIPSIILHELTRTDINNKEIKVMNP
jgi:hypothetical protein